MRRYHLTAPQKTNIELKYQISKITWLKINWETCLIYHICWRLLRRRKKILLKEGLLERKRMRITRKNIMSSQERITRIFRIQKRRTQFMWSLKIPMNSTWLIYLQSNERNQPMGKTNRKRCVSSSTILKETLQR